MPKRLVVLLIAASAMAVAAASPSAGGVDPEAVVSLAPPPTPSTVEDAEVYGFAGQHTVKTRADTWHFAGMRGAGTRVVIIGQFNEWRWENAAAFGELPPAPAATFCVPTGPSPCTIWDGDRWDGVAMAEVVHDMAPDAELLLASSYGTIADIVTWAIFQSADVILQPTVGRLDGPGDGTGPTGEAFDAAVAAGITMVQAVGHSGETQGDPAGYYRWTFADEDADGWVEFTPDGDERLAISGCVAGGFRGLRWSDFGEGAGASDYELVQLEPGSWATTYRTSGDQQGGAPPIEHRNPCYVFGVDEIGVRLDDPGAGTEGDVFEVLAQDMGFEYGTIAGSASGPGEDSANPGVVTVGAVDPWFGDDIGWYSAQGPTNDGRTNPDLVAASCTTTITIPDECFGGTAAAASVVAGAAALRIAEAPSSTPAEIAAWLTESAVEDRGVVGPDNIYGAGELMLPSMGPRPRFRPDARIRGAVRQGLIGNNIYTPTGRGQVATLTAPPYGEVRFAVSIQNDGNAPERFLLGGSRTAFNYPIRYYRGSQDITRRVNDGRFSTPLVQPGATTTIQVRVGIPSHPRVAGIRGTVQALSQTTFQQVDAVQYIARLP